MFQTQLIKKAVKILYYLSLVRTHISQPKEEEQMAVFIDQCYDKNQLTRDKIKLDGSLRGQKLENS